MTDLPIKVLAVLGGAGVGAFAVGASVRLLSRLTTRHQLPAWLMFALRLLGAIVAGWLVALWVFGGGGPLVGGAGGSGLGSGSGGNQKPSPPSTTPELPGTNATGGTNSPAAPGESLQIEILGNEALKRFSPDSRFDPERRYRVESKGAWKVLTLDEVKEFVGARQKESPPLRQISLVLYDDSPAYRVQLVSVLKSWVEDLTAAESGPKMRVNLEQRNQNAPER